MAAVVSSAAPAGERAAPPLLRAETKADREEESRTLLASLVESQRLSTAVKTVFERGWQNTFAVPLSQHVKRKRAEIKAICYEHSEDFVNSVDGLITVRAEMKELRAMIHELNEGTQTAGEALLQAVTRLNETRRVRRNIDEALEIAAKCHEVVKLVTKAEEHVRSLKYFAALKLIDQLRRVYLPRLFEFEFAKQLERHLPYMMIQIRDAVRAEFRTWLNHALAVTPKLGRAVMDQVDERLQAELERKRKVRRARLQQVGAEEKESESNRRVSASGAGPSSASAAAAGAAAAAAAEALATRAQRWEEDAFWNEKALFDQFELDFGAVYQALHVYENLGIAAQFQSLYRESRRAQALQIMDASPGGFGDFMKNHGAYFASVAGVFVIDCAVMKSEEELISRSFLDGIWENALARIKMHLAEQSAYVSDPTLFLQLKYSVVVLARALEMQGLHASQLVDFMADLRERFQQLLLARFRQGCKDVTARDTCEPMLVMGEQEYERSVLGFGLSSAPASSLNFPATMPFSAAVPALCRLVKAFVSDYFEFADFLSLDMEPHIRQALDHVLVQELCGTFNRIVDESPSLHITQAVQFSINCTYLAEACSFFEAYTMSFSERRFPKPLRLAARAAFQQTRMRYEDALFELVSSKVEALTAAAAAVNWAPSTLNERPHDYVLELTRYLQTTFQALTYMPDAVREAVHFTSCKHVASGLLAVLLGPTVKAVNALGLHNLHVDLQALEAAAQQATIPNLAETYSELRQTINFFLNGELEVALDAAALRRAFPHVAVSKLVVLLDKFRDVGLFAAAPANLKKLKKKTAEAVAKKLRVAAAASS